MNCTKPIEITRPETRFCYFLYKYFSTFSMGNVITSEVYGISFIMCYLKPKKRINRSFYLLSFEAIVHQSYLS